MRHMCALLASNSSHPQPQALRVEQRFLRHRRGVALSEIFDLDLRARSGVLDRQIPVGNALAHAITVGRAGDIAYSATIGPDRLLAHHDNRRIAQYHAAELVRVAMLLDPGQRRLPDKVALVEP